MADYDNTNKGVLFSQDDKTNDRAPDYKGKLNVNGRDLEIAGWKKLSKAGKPFLSLSVQEPFDKTKSHPTGKQTAETDDYEQIDIDKIPF